MEKKDYKERYKRIAESEQFKKSHEGMSIGEVMHIEGEELVSEDLEEACEQLAENARKHKAETSSPFFSQTDYIQGVMDGAKWQKENMMKDAFDGDITFDYYGVDDKTYGCIAHNSFCLEDFGLKDRDKVKVIVIKED